MRFTDRLTKILRLRSHRCFQGIVGQGWSHEVGRFGVAIFHTYTKCNKAHALEEHLSERGVRIGCFKFLWFQERNVWLDGKDPKITRKTKFI